MKRISSGLKVWLRRTLWICILIPLSIQHNSVQAASINIHYLGHSAFVLQFDNGINVVCDYGHYNAWVQWGWDSPIHDIGSLIPDIMTYSHNHDDHYDPSRIPTGVPHILTGMDSLDYEGISIRPIRTCEDDYNVESNTSFLFTYKGLKLLHLGDAQAQIINIRINSVQQHILEIIPDSLDMLLMTIEGQTQFIARAEDFVNLLSPKRIIPMHHWTKAYLNDFIAFLETKNESGATYQISRSFSAKYELSDSEQATPTKVLTLTRAPFVVTAIGKKQQNPSGYKLFQNYPNPFNPETTIQVKIEKSGPANLSIYDSCGKRVKCLHNSQMKTGTHKFIWDSTNDYGSKVSSGIYLYKFSSTQYSEQKKMLLLK